MGIFIYVSVSKAITQEEWQPVYEETLFLAKKFHLMDESDYECKNGIQVRCHVPTEERTIHYDGFYKSFDFIGWRACGDYETMQSAEMNSTDKYLVQPDQINANALDPMIVQILLQKGNDEQIYSFANEQRYLLWGSKTQGYCYHMYFLAIACLIESRLGKKAYVYGDITRGQCKKAVELANEYLENPIQVPDSCDPQRFAKRIQDSSLDNKMKIDGFLSMFLGTKDAAFGQAFRENFSKEELSEYWKNKFKNTCPGKFPFQNSLHDYLLWGFDLADLPLYIHLDDGNDNLQYEALIRDILDTKIYLKEKDCRTPGIVDPEAGMPYGIFSLFGQMIFGSAKNKHVDRYIPIEQVKETLKNSLPNCIDTDRIIDEYIREEEQKEQASYSKGMSEGEVKDALKTDGAGILNQFLDMKRDELEEEIATYDIIDAKYFLFYTKGDSIEPKLREQLLKNFAVYIRSVQQEKFFELLDATPYQRCQYLAVYNDCFWLRNQDWEKIFADIEEHTESFMRYFPITVIAANSEDLIAMVQSFVINDDLYEYCLEHFKEVDEKK
jgi:hypothetical protein